MILSRRVAWKAARVQQNGVRIPGAVCFYASAPTSALVCWSPQSSSWQQLKCTATHVAGAMTAVRSSRLGYRCLHSPYHLDATGGRYGVCWWWVRRRKTHDRCRHFQVWLSHRSIVAKHEREPVRATGSSRHRAQGTQGNVWRRAANVPYGHELASHHLGTGVVYQGLHFFRPASRLSPILM